ncbi:hypothetical protein PVK06_040011 [Gossypium arboreum]|uniref:Uncharacterized protein n=1 Tax=Gossypium arboreum TaxID=29729 RepID=A0ABR0N6I9_GOSAR|nr:hypothetical protein PVK06_040011 [Gossypium arboreum]
MAKTRGSIKKATRFVGEHASSTTIVRKLESLRPVQTKELAIFLNKATKEQFHDNMLKRIFHPEQGISLFPQQDLGRLVYKTILKLKQTGILVFPSLVMLLCQQRGIVPRASEEIVENKGPINEASIERMTRGKNAPILKEAKTNKTRKGKAKADSKGTNLNTETSLCHKLKNVEKMVNSINNRAWNSSIVATLGQLSPSPLPKFLVFPPIIQNYDLSSLDDDLEDRDRSVASPPIVQVSEKTKEEESRDIEKCLQKIDCLFQDGIFANQLDTIVEKEVVATKEEVVDEKEEVAEKEKEKEGEDSVEKTIIVPKSVGVNIDNLEQAGTRPALREPEAADDTGIELGTERQFKDHARPKEMKRKCSKNKK